MATQLKVEELSGCKTYLGWLRDKVKTDGELSRVMFGRDFVWTVPQDEIRAKDATNLRNVYAKEVGKENRKSEREIDRIWKSVHGKCCVFELIVALCVRMDEMVNEGNPGEMVPKFYEKLMDFMGASVKDDEDFDLKEAATEAFWNSKIDRFMDRKYEFDGSGGGLFPLKNAGCDQRKEPLWNQLNWWIGEHLDDDCVFRW